MTERTYAAELDDGDVVVRAIVGTAVWAVANLGGRWIDSDVKVGVGSWWDGESFWEPEPEVVIDWFEEET